MKTRMSDSSHPVDEATCENVHLKMRGMNSSEEDIAEPNENLRTINQKWKNPSSNSRNRRKASKEKNRSLSNDVIEANSNQILEKIPKEVGKESFAKEFAEDTDSCNSNNNSSLIQRSGDKSRNLDLVLRRMLQAKKESEKLSDASSGASELIDIKANENNLSTKLLSAAQPEGYDISPQGRENAHSNGMIDVQLKTANHIQESGVRKFTNTRETSAQVTNDCCSSPESSLEAGVGSDNEGASLKPFVQSSSAIVETSRVDSEQEEKSSMSPIIKQEPVSAIDSRLAMYHTNGPADTHSPSSSYGSQPSPEQRSPSPISPRNTGRLPSPPELILQPPVAQSHMSPSSSEAMILMNGSVNSYLPTIFPPHSSPIRYSRHSPLRHSPRSMMPYAGDVRRSPVATAAAMAASELALPTLVPPMSSIPPNGPSMFHMAENSLLSRNGMVAQYSEAANVYGLQRRGENDSLGPKMSPNAPTGPNPPRGIIGQKAAAAANGARTGNGNRRNNTDEKCPYKRPPHTYPALIASAILDSPGNLITLRGIYDYIMNNFPYYKFGHDKSAWQNSIRHNLSLNQCFVKVPRYENAAKSNYWTMTPEGFEEFGNENSFKRRRRRGAALAPISAYKNKKYGNAEGTAKQKQRNTQGENSGLSNGSKGPVIGPSFVNWGGRSRTPEPHLGYNAAKDAAGLVKGMKRAASPGARMNGHITPKHPRMVVLKQGEGPALEALGGQNDHPQRPNSLSSVEEMQGNVNSFSKRLSSATDTTPGSSRSPRHNQGRNSPLGSFNQPTPQQQWMMMAAAAQKNLYAASLIPPSLMATSSANPPPLVPSNMTSSEDYPMSAASTEVQSKLAGLGSLGSNSVPVIFDHVEIGSQVPLLLDNAGSVSAWSLLCRFCDYKYISESPASLEQHCQLHHHLEMTNVKAKAVAAAVAGNHDSDGNGSSKSPNGGQDPNASMMSLQSMVSGFAAAAGYNNAQSLLAAAQVAGISLPGTVPHAGSMTMSNPTTSTAPYFTDPLMRSLAQQIGNGSGDSTLPGSEALHRSQMAALNAAIQQAAMNSGGSSPLQQEQQLRQLIYQQMLMQSPLFPGNSSLAASMSRQMPGGRSDMTPLSQFWHYQQKMMEITSQKEKDQATDESEQAELKTKALQNFGSRKSPNRNRKNSSSSSSSGQDHNTNATNENAGKQTDIHGWKQCQYCNFTAKGTHGLELHYRKAHAFEGTKSGDQDGKRNHDNSTPTNQNSPSPSHVTRDGTESSDSKDVRQASDAKVIDEDTQSLSGKDDTTRSDSSFRNTAATQTESDENAAERRSCRHCDVTFGDDTMHALHMSCHDRNDPFKCTICGQSCHEKYYFNVHLLRGLHQPLESGKKQSNNDRETSQVSSGRRHSSTSEKSVSSTASEGRHGPTADRPKRSPSSVSLPEVSGRENSEINV